MVVRVVCIVHQSGLDQAARPQFVRPYMQAGWPVLARQLFAGAACVEDGSDCGSAHGVSSDYLCWLATF